MDDRQMLAEVRAPDATIAAQPSTRSCDRYGSGRVMWLSSERVLYAGLLGQPSQRTLGAITLYAALAAPVRISIDGGPWQSSNLALVQPYVPHRVACDGRLICDLLIEPETVDMPRLPSFLRQSSGPLNDAEVLARVRAAHARLCRTREAREPAAFDFDEQLFGSPLPARPVDARIATVLAELKRDPAQPLTAQDCADAAQLSFSRFLHLFKQETGVPFRVLRGWKRARSLLQYVGGEANLLQVALAAGYPDSTHFSHSIRQVYGLQPRQIFAGSRRLALLRP